jgi:signal transduction histidine kinase
MNDFIHNASHELKTPISVVSSNLQLLKELKSFEPDLILSSIDEIKRIDNLIV